MPGIIRSLVIVVAALGASFSARAQSVPAALEADRDWVRVHAELPERARVQALDYGAFYWLPRRVVLAAGEAIDHSAVVVRNDAFTLELGGLRFDPLLDAPPEAEVVAGWQPADGADWRLVQFHGPVHQDWLDSLRAEGVEPVQYIHPYTYVVWGRGHDLARTAAQPSVRWQGEFLPRYRLPPVFRRDGADIVEVHLMVRSGLFQARAGIIDAGAEIISIGAMDRHFDAVDVWVSEDRLPDLARIPGVYSVQPAATDGGTRSEMSVQINHQNVDEGGVALTGYLAYLEELGLDGSGVVMACVDNGVQTNHPDLANRILPCAGPSCGSGSQTDGHGTHVAGIMAGDGASGVLNSGGFLRGLGMAPGAGLINQTNGSVGAPWLLNLMRESVRNGATISNNSWGPSGSPQGYDNNTRQVDIGVRDADVDAPGDQPLTYVLAFMNGFGGTSSQGTPDEAKNVFTIGSAWAQVNANTQDLRNDEISANSAHGPALDGRFIPHMIANSRFTDSPLGSSGYGMQGGTSQAAPHVAGAIALFTEYYRQAFKAEPSPALIKAAFLAVTRDLEGENDADDNPIGARPDSKQGWGRMMAAPVLAPELPTVYVDQQHVFAATGETWNAEFLAADPNQAMRLMLVWTDAPGHGLGGSTPAWNNDLDLRVSAGDDLYLGNVFESGWSATGGSADFRNNTEGVLLQADQHGGAISVEVLAAAINANALPNAGEDNSQDFALVCYNCVGAQGADLGVGLSALPDPVVAGDTLTWVVQVVNFGQDDAEAVTVTLELPPEAGFIAAQSRPDRGPDWVCEHENSIVSCELPGSLGVQTLAPILDVVTTISAGTPNSTILAEAVVSAETDDPQPGNNTAVRTVQVVTDLDQVFQDAFECAAGGC